MTEATEQPLVGAIDNRQLRHFLVSRRRACGWTQEELAERSGVSVRTIRNIETGSQITPRRASVKLLLAAFGTSFGQLTGETPARSLPSVSEIPPARRREPPWLPEQTVNPARWRGARPATETLVGRREDLRHILATVQHSRLLVLTGPGGVGKTRLALSAAAQMQGMFRDGVAVVELAHCVPEKTGGTASYEQVRHAVLTVVRQACAATDPAGAELLLVVDNAEHVVRSVARLVLELQAGHPELRILITSRRPLAITAADVWEVAPLDVDSWEDPTSPPAAVELFLRRVRSAAPTISLAGRMPLVIELCRRLEGFPRAIETAARRVRSVSLESMLRSGSTLHMLDQIHLSTASRHRSMAESIRWSYDLLTPSERVLLHQLVGAFETFTVEDVVRSRFGCRDEDTDVLATLADLADSSLVRVHRGARYEYRVYRMVRDYVAALDRGRMPSVPELTAVARSA